MSYYGPPPEKDNTVLIVVIFIVLVLVVVGIGVGVYLYQKGKCTTDADCNAATELCDTTAGKCFVKCTSATKPL